MKTFSLHVLLLLICNVKAETSFAQTAGIASGEIYTLKSKSGSKLLNVSSASRVFLKSRDNQNMNNGT